MSVASSHREVAASSKGQRLSKSAPLFNESKGFFHCWPKPLALSGPIIKYRQRTRMQKREAQQFKDDMIEKWTLRNTNSPYKMDFLKLHADAGRITKSKLEERDREEGRQRIRESRQYKRSCEEAWESEARHCHVDHISTHYKELRILAV